MSFSISGKTAIVTGAANGIGRAIARQFADAGANVMFADMDEEGLDAEVGKEAEEDDGNIRSFSADLREKLAQANLLSATIDAFDRVDVLVNASRQVMPTDPLDPEDDSLDRLMQQNLVTSYRLSQLVARRMISQAEALEEPTDLAGSIINLSSIAACRTQPGMLAYSVSTAALDQLTRSMAVTLAPHSIRVNAIAFGSVMSASLQSVLREKPDLRDDITSHTPLGRIAEASEVADAAQFLASGGSGFITGQVLTIDGGRTLIDSVGARAH